MPRATRRGGRPRASRAAFANPAAPGYKQSWTRTPGWRCTPWGKKLRADGYAIATVSAMGMNAVRLHVFGNNDIARFRYQKLGYAETDVIMTKHLHRQG